MFPITYHYGKRIFASVEGAKTHVLEQARIVYRHILMSTIRTSPNDYSVRIQRDVTTSRFRHHVAVNTTYPVPIYLAMLAYQRPVILTSFGTLAPRSVSDG